MSEGVTIRRLRPADRAGWGSLWEGYLHFYRAALDDEVTDATFGRLCAEGGDLVGLIAIAPGEKPIGLAHLVFHPSTWARAPSCYLEDLFVDRAARGSDVGKQLLDAVISLAREQGASRVYWVTQQYNSPARSLYDTVARLTSFVVYEREFDA